MIRSMDKRVKKGHRAMLVILTDGFENASETSSKDVRKLIHEREKRGWEFIYLGANQDAWAESGRIGLAQRGKSFDFAGSPEGTRVGATSLGRAREAVPRRAGGVRAGARGARHANRRGRRRRQAASGANAA